MIKMPSEKTSSWKHNFYLWMLDAVEMMAGAWSFLAVVHFISKIAVRFLS
jgi:hypothetical protein